jgi:hypothetical protein
MQPFQHRTGSENKTDREQIVNKTSGKRYISEKAERRFAFDRKDI